MEQTITYMSPLPISIKAQSTVAFARACLGVHRAYSLPCVNREGCLVGVITVDSLAYAKPDETVLTYMTLCEPISALAPIIDAVDRLFTSQFDCLPVVIGDYVVGLLSWYDVASLPIAHKSWCDYSNPFIDPVLRPDAPDCECGNWCADHTPELWQRASA